MKISYKAAVIVATLVLSACTHYTVAEVDAQLDQLKGLSQDQLIAILGVPNKQIKTEQKRHLEWLLTEVNSSSSRVSVGTGSGGRGWFGALGVSFPISSEPDTCLIRATFPLDTDTLETIDWEGDQNYCGAQLRQKIKN
ncbi:hypothetical protein [Pleionea litopenaei]|uniref:Uncharacterized protein n=1 Tax=Pleionea litopenaei TaxID=3070815 RepID=A0AA51RW93_9GAMM|nr:hypothetical protein [Pleionea sp. HL-JVS1]WMS88603.1 hypothetical protein Q9312_06730 [Pleionea sp. HL-JVS1]